MYQGVLNATLAPVVISTNPGPGVVIWPMFLYMRPVSAAVLSALTVTVRWNDGVARSHSEIVALTSLALFQGSVFIGYQAAGTDISIEALLTGLGSCEIYLVGNP